MYDPYDFTHPHETLRTRSGFEVGHPFTADNGCHYNRDKMRRDGFELFQDFQHPEYDHVTRWWFRNLKAWHKYTEGIEAKGFVAIDHLKIS